MLDGLDLKILELRLQGKNKADIARSCNIARSTVYARLEKPELQQAINDGLAESERVISTRSVNTVDAAYSALEGILKQPLGIRPLDRIRAAEVALKYQQKH